MLIQNTCVYFKRSMDNCSKKCSSYNRCVLILELITKSEEICTDCIHESICKKYKKHYFVFLPTFKGCKYKKVKE